MTPHPNLAAIDQALAIARSSLIKDFLTYMRRLHPASRLPGRTAFDPMALPHLLGNIVLVEVHPQADGGMRFFVRVAGETVLRAAPVPMMNRYIDVTTALTEDTAEQSRAIILDVRRKAVETGQLVYHFGKIDIPYRFDFTEVEFVHFPLADDGATVNRVLSCFHYHGAEAA